jgi:hypothetical protein
MYKISVRQFLHANLVSGNYRDVEGGFTNKEALFLMAPVSTSLSADKGRLNLTTFIRAYLMSDCNYLNNFVFSEQGLPRRSR